MEADGIRSLTYGSNGSIYRIVQSRGRHKVSVKDSAAYLSPALILDSPNLKCSVAAKKSMNSCVAQASA